MSRYRDDSQDRASDWDEETRPDVRLTCEQLVERPWIEMCFTDEEEGRDARS